MTDFDTLDKEMQESALNELDAIVQQALADLPELMRTITDTLILIDKNPAVVATMLSLGKFVDGEPEDEHVQKMGKIVQHAGIMNGTFLITLALLANLLGDLQEKNFEAFISTIELHENAHAKGLPCKDFAALEKYAANQVGLPEVYEEVIPFALYLNHENVVSRILHGFERFRNAQSD